MDPRNTSKLKIMLWNADSVSKKKAELLESLITNEIDIALISETYLKRDVPFSLPNYKCHRLDRNYRPKGGVAILVRLDLPHTLLQSFDMTIMECIGISVETTSGKIVFISAYRPGGRSSPDNIS